MALLGRRANGMGLLLALVLPGAVCWPRWDWHTVQTYVHCANTSGPWSTRALDALITQNVSFVVQELPTARDYPPVNRSAELKMVAAGRQIKARDPTIEVLMYNPVFPVVTWYDYARSVDLDHPEYELRYPNGSMVVWGDPGANGGGHIGDFSTAGWRAAWSNGMLTTIKTGAIDGVFIDGFRGDAAAGAMGPPAGGATVSPEWGTGVNTSTNMLRAGMGPAGTCFGNYGCTDASDRCVVPPGCWGMMVERGGGGASTIKLLRAHGREARPIEFHAQYADRSAATFNISLASFMAGMGPNAFFGAGGGWGGPGPTACASWLLDRTEYHKAVGVPVSEAAESPPGHFRRTFASGTKVLVIDTAPKTPRKTLSCIWWADGTTTGDPATCSSGRIVR